MLTYCLRHMRLKQYEIDALTRVKPKILLFLGNRLEAQTLNIERVVFS